MKKILIIITTEFVPHGGLTTVMMNYYRSMDKAGLQLDFASTNILTDEEIASYFEPETRYFSLDSRKKKFFHYLLNLYRLLRNEKYNVIHVNGNSATMILELAAARFAGIPVRIAHGHTTRSNYPVAHKMLSPLFRLTYTKAIATSEATGKWLYGNKFTVLNNAIDVAHYTYSPELREQVRTELNLHGKYVVGNIGKLNPSKNQHFLLEIFHEIRKKRNDAVLLIAGGGPLEEELKAFAKELHIDEYVVFLGMINDTSSVLQAMDVFVFPSLFEGLGLALIEAQAAGLECFASDAVPLEAKVSDHVQFLTLQETAKLWADWILSVNDYDRLVYAKSAAKTIGDNGYNICKEADKLRMIYMD